MSQAFDRPPADPPPRVGIGDVAERAGVSRATVSRVMNRNRTVRPEIAARVRDAAEKLGYHPSSLGRGLVLGRTETIGVVIPDLANPMFQELLRALSRAAARDGYRVLFADSSETPSEEAILADEMRRRCDGVVLASPRLDPDALAGVAGRLRPLVLLNRTLDGHHGVSVDYRAGILALARHLLSLGHRRLAYVAGPSISVSNEHRLDGLAQLVDEHEDVTVTVVEGGVHFASGYAAAEPVLATEATAVMAFNDLVAMGLISSLHERQVAVPDALSVTGFDDIPFARYAHPSITTCRVPIVDAADACWREMASQLRGGPSRDDVLLEATLVERGSTGPAPTRPRARRR